MRSMIRSAPRAGIGPGAASPARGRRTARALVLPAVAATALLAITLPGCSGSGNRNPGEPGTPGFGRIEGEVLLGESPMSVPTVVTYGRNDQGLASRRTNDEGRFLFLDVESGSARVWVIPPHGFTLADGQPNPAPVVVPPAGEARLSIRLEAVQDSTGLDSTKVGFLQIESTDGIAAVSGISVKASLADGTFEWWATTGGDGRALGALPAGGYDLTALAPAWYEVTGIDPGRVEVVAGETDTVRVTVRQVGELPPGTLVVFVANPDSLDPETAVPEGVPVRVSTRAMADFIVDGETDSTGHAYFDLPAGVYDVSITVPEGWSLWPDYENPRIADVVAAMATWAPFYLSPVPERTGLATRRR